MSPERKAKENKTPWPYTNVSWSKPGVILINSPDGGQTIIEIPKKKEPLPDSIIDSIIPYFESVFDKYRDTLAVDLSFWTDQSKEADFTSIKAAHMARAAGYLARDLSDAALSRIQVISGNNNLATEKVTNKFLDDLETAIKDLYNTQDEIYPTEQIKLLKKQAHK